MKTPILLTVLVGLLLVVSASGYGHLLSPDGRFETYTTSCNPDNTGMQLFLRMAGSKATGVLLRANDRWIRVNWSPDSRFLAVIDGSDGHVTDVFIYRVLQHSGTAKMKAHYLTFRSVGVIADSARLPGILVKLWYHTPDLFTYDVQWDVSGWDVSRSIVLLIKRSRTSKSVRIKVELNSPQTPK